MSHGTRPHPIPRFSIAFLALALVTAPPSPAQNLPDGFAYESLVTRSFEQAVAFTTLPDGRFVIVERTGPVHLAAVGMNGTDFLLTVPDVESAAQARGLLGVAVDPDWPTRPYLYFYYTHTSSRSYITMYRASGNLTNPSITALNLGDPFHVLTDMPDVYISHQAGTLRFGPDGMLLVSLGDDNIPCNAQTPAVLAGKVLRLDVSSLPGPGIGPPAKSAITPADNPFVGVGDSEGLVLASGLRNPFRFTVDALSGDIFLGDVGLNSFEEISRIDGASGGGENFGWPQFEGFLPQTCCGACGISNPFTEPIYGYAHSGPALKSVIAGPLYRPARSLLSFSADYEGSLFLTDFFDGWIRRLDSANDWDVAGAVPGQPSADNWAEDIPGIVDFQLGADGALYVLRLGAVNELARIFATSSSDFVAPGRDPGLRLTVHPNPTAAGAMIRWNDVRSASIRIVDVSGRTVQTLAPGLAQAIQWDGRTGGGRLVPPGVYFVRLDVAGGRTRQAKLSVIR